VADNATVMRRVQAWRKKEGKMRKKSKTLETKQGKGRKSGGRETVVGHVMEETSPL